MTALRVRAMTTPNRCPEVRPKYVFIENVGAIRSNGLRRVLKDLAELGYDAEWHTIPAAAVGACGNAVVPAVVQVLGEAMLALNAAA